MPPNTLVGAPVNACHRTLWSVSNMNATCEQRLVSSQTQRPPPLAPQRSESMLGAKICGAELGAMYSGVEVPAMSTPPRMPCSDTSEPRSVALRRVTLAP